MVVQMEILNIVLLIVLTITSFRLYKDSITKAYSLSFYERVMQEIQDGVVVFSVNGKDILYKNQKAKELFDDIDGFNFIEYLAEDMIGLPQRLHIGNKWLDIICSRHQEGRNQHTILTIRDMTALVIRQEEAKYLATYDNMTMLPNKKSLERSIVHILEKSDRKSALLYVDIDNFKAVNERHGIEAGDGALNGFVNQLHALLDTLAEKDMMSTFGRLDGDDFIIFINGYPDFSHVMHLADKIIEVSRMPVNHGKEMIVLSCCIGIAVSPDHGKTYTELLNHGFIALRQAKTQQRGCFQVYSKQMLDDSRSENAIEVALKHSLAKNEFYMCYQPIYDKSSRIIGAEALVRWNRENGKAIFPDRFIPLCEKSGLIVELDRMTTKLVTDFVKEHAEELNGLPISINISPVTFMDLRVMKSIEDLLCQDELYKAQIKIEITENLALENLAYAQFMIESLSKNQIQVQLDDFGSGYSSLSYISRFKFDAVKIDRALSKEYDTESGYAILQAIYRIGKALELDVIVEGVEDQEQKDSLVMIGFENFQGYHFDKPLSEADFLGRIAMRR